MTTPEAAGRSVQQPLDQDVRVDGLTSTTAAAALSELEGELREVVARSAQHALGVADPDRTLASLQPSHRTRHTSESSARRRSAAGNSRRVYLPAPARWKASDSRARLHAVDWATVIPVAPPPRKRTAVMSNRSDIAQPSSLTNPWLLPPTWPLEDWSPRLVIRKWWWARSALTLSRRASRPRLLAAAAVLATTVMVFAFARIQPPARLATRPIRSVVVAPVMQTPTLAVPSPPKVPAPVITAVPVSAAIVPVQHDVDSRKPWTDVSTMDLMMPIAEPDLDIRSRGSLWSQVGKAAGVDPLLLYSIALVESKALYPDGKVAPTPWLFRVNDHLVRGDRRDVQLAMAAASQFGSGVQDVGIMQVYYPMHRDAVRDPLTLLNPHTNISVAAKILRDGMRQTHDRVLGIGYYHSHTPSLARDYGTAVMTVYQRLRALHRQSPHARGVARG
jgi:soluble lytic murein transglycosylase-like protein